MNGHTISEIEELFEWRKRVDALLIAHGLDVMPERCLTPEQERRMDVVYRTVQRAYGVSAAVMQGRSKLNGCAWPRQVAAYMSRSLLGYTLQVVAAYTHSQHDRVIRQCQAVCDQVETSKATALEVGHVREECEKALERSKGHHEEHEEHEA